MGISRIEQPEKKHFGYYVRLMWRGKQYAKFFSDKKYGGKQKALKAAEKYFDELDEQMPLDSQVGRMSVRNTSGIVGVSRTKSASRGHRYEYWQARWGSGDNRKSAKFSIHKYGEEKAKQLAIEARQQWEKEAGVE
ncbi:AP2 domain-containing protein [Oscillatoria sp. FACHB-1407]|uniref:AP2/ERF family transcription factor n=1 Tax=Oscillatoria sp. FACHB-1407 TaxID=2692847 RepID=UPI0016877AEB|nr:AP2/ERF family transcription factor [Oscillatoria sp. FACHB-1407]MBD2462368.1 AP2 domain-containing protein [Oscillatoria sp. FACHB-1407]